MALREAPLGLMVLVSPADDGFESDCTMLRCGGHALGGTCGPLSRILIVSEKRGWICWHGKDWKWKRGGLLMKQIWEKSVGNVVRDRSERFHPAKEVESCLQKQTQGKQRMRKCRVMLAGRASKGHARVVKERGSEG